MECKDCKYYKERSSQAVYSLCTITHICNTKSCGLESDNEVEHMDICYNCKYWIGGGDWGLSCMKDYYNYSSNGFD